MFTVSNLQQNNPFAWNHKNKIHSIRQSQSSIHNFHISASLEIGGYTITTLFYLSAQGQIGISVFRSLNKFVVAPSISSNDNSEFIHKQIPTNIPCNILLMFVSVWFYVFLFATFITNIYIPFLNNLIILIFVTIGHCYTNLKKEAFPQMSSHLRYSFWIGYLYIKTNKSIRINNWINKLINTLINNNSSNNIIW